MADSSHNDPSSPSSPSAPPPAPASAPASPPFSDSPPSSTSSSSASALRALPRPISIRHSQSYEPAPPSPTGDDSPVIRGVRSSASLNLLVSSSQHPALNQKQQKRSQMLPPRSLSSFSNTFKKIQSTFGSAKRNLDLSSGSNHHINNGNSSHRNSNSNNANTPGWPLGKSLSTSASANSLTSWKVRGAEIFSKGLGRNRKNSEPLLKTASSAMLDSSIFGIDLKEAIRLSHIPDTPMVPAVLHRCAEFLEARGVDEVGLYRVPGSHANVQRLKRMFDTGRDYNLLEMDGIEPNDIATLFKLYLRELPSPLMPPVLLEKFQSLLTTDRHICQTLRSILVLLPRENYIVLSYLCHHLSKIASHSDKTKMTVSNLALVFAPTLAVGSVLFKALLGGFYDNAVDSPENREKGLQIVWGGFVKDENGNIIQEWPENEDDNDGSVQTPGDKEEYVYSDQEFTQEHHRHPHPHLYHLDDQQQHALRHKPSELALSPFSDPYGSVSNNNSSYFPSVPLENQGPLDLELDDRPMYGQVLENPFSSTPPSHESLVQQHETNNDEDEDDDDDDIEHQHDQDQEEDAAESESALMNAMLEREELAAKSPPAPSSPATVSEHNENSSSSNSSSSSSSSSSASNGSSDSIDANATGTSFPTAVSNFQSMLPSHLTSTATTPSYTATTMSTASSTNTGGEHQVHAPLAGPTLAVPPAATAVPSATIGVIYGKAMPSTATATATMTTTATTTTTTTAAQQQVQGVTAPYIMVDTGVIPPTAVASSTIAPPAPPLIARTLPPASLAPSAMDKKSKRGSMMITGDTSLLLPVSI
ncbi:hypothetical protein EDD11_002816 [Mortierella claussenii]|nr:hypothetical protein EDD11_002816 [Mortierella claussenii]